MKLIIRLLILTSLPLVFVACGDDSTIENSEFTQSLRAWNSFKATAANSYIYKSSTPLFTGASNETTIVVSDGNVISREYIFRDENNDVVDQWTENENTLDSHAEGAPPITIDDVYQECADNILSLSEETHDITFTVDAEGILSICSATEIGIQDGAGESYTIDNITPNSTE